MVAMPVISPGGCVSPARSRARWRSRRDEDGSALETALVFPALLLILMVILQAALHAHASAVAEAAAQDAAAVTRRADGSQTGGVAAGYSTLSALGSRMLTDRSVSVTRSATTASVTVSGRSVSLVPGLRLRVSESAEGPVERFVPLGQQP